ncbi:MAG: FISUMP domain-containing protein [Bacteroidales bacterium]
MKHSLLFLLSALILTACKKEEVPVNREPGSPTLQAPADQSQNQSTRVLLTWDFAEDPDGDAVTYTVYLDAGTEPQTLVSSSQRETSFQCDLERNQRYSWKVVATDPDGKTAESSTWTFTTGTLSWDEDGESGVFLDLRDGKEYRIVKIGTQIWMAENLAYLPSVSLQDAGSEDVIHEGEAMHYVYGFEGVDVSTAKAHENYEKYGVLYNWTAAMEAAPEGWHLPTALEYDLLETYIVAEHNLEDYMGGYPEVALHLSPSNWNTNAYDTYGFTALAGGYRTAEDGFLQEGSYGTWWSASEEFPQALYRGINKGYPPTLLSFFGAGPSSKHNGRSVRCVMD